VTTIFVFGMRRFVYFPIEEDSGVTREITDIRRITRAAIPGSLSCSDLDRASEADPPGVTHALPRENPPGDASGPNLQPDSVLELEIQHNPGFPKKAFDEIFGRVRASQ
jgi:hypothetical protein